MTYESAIKKLGEIIEKLSSDSVPLAEATALFEEGLTLMKYCYKEIKVVKGKIYEIKEELGKLKLEENDENF